MDRTKTLKPTVANDPHAISSPSSKSFRVACAGRGGMLDYVVEAKSFRQYRVQIIVSRNRDNHTSRTATVLKLYTSSIKREQAL